ncbi:replication-relaxation family protein [Actinomadura sp. WAC 06369]|uniref:replication-relaxation family protein n=1 Tax=Actinomadura sp. WAC 06369 TaxID=2203193 RepID=UPI0013152EFD|nr:replication-relaxation family protein [Actinomadura sp. WAC 06369]
MTAALIADLAHRLTARDRAILSLVWEHRVLTSDQITALFFRTTVRTHQRLRQLHELHALSHFRPWVPAGTAAKHWVLGPAGAHVLAVEQGVNVRELGYRHETALGIAVSPRLGHQVGVNDFFVRLRAHARHRDDGTRLTRWWPERRCVAEWGDHARPDAFGRWREASRPTSPPTEIDFFLEHDTGTERLARVAAKLNGYAALASETGITTPILFWLPSPAREANLRKVIGIPKVPVATAVQTPRTAPEGPAGNVWLPVGATGPRQRLAALAHAWEFTT